MSKFKSCLSWCRRTLEYLGGSAEIPPPGLRLAADSAWWGLWWGLLLCVIAVCCGQASKFIYIDF